MRVNVHGALEVLRFACAVRAKPLLFVSTIAVCFAEGHNGAVDEDADMLDNVAAMPLGYAQSKCVAESLLRQASQRGLPVTILRPALISGDSVTGDVNLDDLIAALVEGCAAAGAAIDVDWLLDCVPVDFVATVLARLPAAPGAGLSVLHLIHDQARHWREVVLWMNLYGCPVKLLPRDEWLEASFTHRAVAGTRLYGYRRFFQGYRAGETTPRPFEAFLEPHQRRIANRRTAQALATIGVALPPLDAPLLRRYFEHYRSAGLLPQGTPQRDTAPTETLVAADFERLLRQRTGVRVLRIVAAQPLRFASVNGILNEISSVRLGARVGIRRYALTVERLRSSAALRFDTLVKTKATDAVLTALSVEIAALCAPHSVPCSTRTATHSGWRARTSGSWRCTSCAIHACGAIRRVASVPCATRRQGCGPSSSSTCARSRPTMSAAGSTHGARRDWMPSCGDWHRCSRSVAPASNPSRRRVHCCSSVPPPRCSRRPRSGAG